MFESSRLIKKNTVGGSLHIKMSHLKLPGTCHNKCNRKHSEQHFILVFRLGRMRQLNMALLPFSLAMSLLSIINSSTPMQMNAGKTIGNMATEEIQTLWRSWVIHPSNKSIKQSIVDANITTIPNGTFEMFHSLEVGIQCFWVPE